MHADDAQPRPEGGAGDRDTPGGGLWPPEEWPPRSNEIRPFQGPPAGRPQDPPFPDTWWRSDDATQAIPVVPAEAPVVEGAAEQAPPAAAEPAPAPEAADEVRPAEGPVAAEHEGPPAPAALTMHEPAAAAIPAGALAAAPAPAPQQSPPLPAAVPAAALRGFADTWANDDTPPYGMPAVEDAPKAPAAGAGGLAAAGLLAASGPGGARPPHPPTGADAPDPYEDVPPRRPWWRSPLVLLPVSAPFAAVLIVAAVLAGRSLSGTDPATGPGTVSVLHGSGGGAASAQPSAQPDGGTPTAPPVDTVVGPGGVVQTVSPTAGGKPGTTTHNGTTTKAGAPGAAPGGANAGGPASTPKPVVPCKPAEIRQTLEVTSPRPYGATVSWTWLIKNLADHVCTMAPAPGNFDVVGPSGVVWRQNGTSQGGFHWGDIRFPVDPLPPRPFDPGESTSGSGRWNQEQDGTSSAPQPTQVPPGTYTLEAPGVSDTPLRLQFVIEDPPAPPPSDTPTPAAVTPTP
ncbi:MAG: hypothetical protein JWM67_275 [Mycobacterium sp.]|nr:hypothetical protein [Mycobacterium sp.]